MSNYKIILDIIFGLYLFNFITGFMNAFFTRKRILADYIFGIILIILMLNI